MKKTLRVALILMVGLILMSNSSCDEFKQDKPKKNVKREFTTNPAIDIIVIDECEYIVFDGGNRGGICHKGNCKYCAGRK